MRFYKQIVCNSDEKLFILIEDLSYIIVLFFATYSRFYDLNVFVVYSYVLLRSEFNSVGIDLALLCRVDKK